MSSRASIGRHRAEVQRTSLSTIAKAVSSNAGGVGRQAAVVATASGLVFSAGVPAQASVVREANPTTALTGQIGSVALSVPADVKVSFERAAISSEAAPAVEAQPVETAVQSNAAAEIAAEPVQQEAAAAVEAQPAPAAQAAPAQPVEQQSVAPAGDLAAGIASAAYAQIGVNQDCTMLVTNALAAVGINHHGWPDSYFSLGTTISAAEAKPGDLVYYANGGTGMAHIAVYVGNGQAVHGGWYGTTKLASVNVGSGPVYIRVNG